MPRAIRPIDQIPEDVLEAAASEFVSCALKALEGRISNQSELARRLGWPDSTLSSALKGAFTFRSWPQICIALNRDPIDELARGRDAIRREEDQAREDAYRAMLERAEADTMVSFWRRLSIEQKRHVLNLMSEEESME